MKEIYFTGVAASFLLIVVVMIRNKFWNDFKECTSKSEIFGMAFSVFVGFFIYSLFSWISFAELIYSEFFPKD